ncbi:hypothetical protein [Aporhodopirellula aestuarii]|uniref:ATP synthase F0 subunit 8 n=1 Tax=Aporhodopirellula aestuarii TaxID=2950107 RepID=A0ABT0UD14_9BACT|nr:hypothetical protein [Aporhodopirellula aestuarii]MCM2374746.1 hypothetical protein [Aporhodopirellula aestuarii]
MKGTPQLSQIDLWISGVALLLSLVLLIASTLVCSHWRSSKAQIEKPQITAHMVR